MSTEQDNKIRRFVVGSVLSAKRDKTITVEVSRQFRHPTYGKYVTHFSKYHAHDEKNESQVGDTVKIVSGRPISKTKSWYLEEIIKRVEG